MPRLGLGRPDLWVPDPGALVRRSETTGAVADGTFPAFGAWTTVIASLTYPFALTGFKWTASAAGGGVQVEFGYGPAGNERVLGRLALSTGNTVQSLMLPLAFPSAPSGSRFAVRWSGSAATNFTLEGLSGIRTDIQLPRFQAVEGAYTATWRSVSLATTGSEIATLPWPYQVLLVTPNATSAATGLEWGYGTPGVVASTNYVAGIGLNHASVLIHQPLSVHESPIIPAGMSLNGRCFTATGDTVLTGIRRDLPILVNDVEFGGGMNP